MTTAPEPFGCACVIVAAMGAAGLTHTAWMRSPWSLRFAIALDAGATWRGRRILGANKTLRGFMAMVPGAALAFGALGLVREHLPAWLAAGVWDHSPVALAAIGAWAGFCFMAGELPNSFFKRRLGVEPGCVPDGGGFRPICLIADRFDSTLAVLIGLSLVVPVPGATWLGVLALGPAVHFGFSALLYASGIKARFA